MTLIKIDGWESLPEKVREDVRAYVRLAGFEIADGGFLQLGDILMDIDHRGYHDWAEHVKAYIGAVIYIVLFGHQRYEETGINDVNLDIPGPGEPRLIVKKEVN